MHLKRTSFIVDRKSGPEASLKRVIVLDWWAATGMTWPANGVRTTNRTGSVFIGSIPVTSHSYGNIYVHRVQRGEPFQNRPRKGESKAYSSRSSGAGSEMTGS